VFSDRHPSASSAAQPSHHSAVASSANTFNPSVSPPLPPSSSPRRTLHPLEPADFLADDAELDILDDDDEGGEEQEDEVESSSLIAASSARDSLGLPPPAKILVAVRKRPLNSRERARGESDVVSLLGSSSLTVLEPKTRVDLTKFEAAHTFHFDAAFGELAGNSDIYSRMCRPLVGFVMAGRGGRASCFAYGQTGGGKTFTLMGPQGGKLEQSGLYVLAAGDMFDTLRARQREELATGTPEGPSLQTKFVHCALYVSFFEIYSGKLYDLLHARSKLVCRADAAGVVHVVGLRERKCKDVSELMALIAEGNKVRSTGVTGANIDSSRSHAILSISLRQIVPVSSGMVVTKGAKTQVRLKTQGKFSFIDLAGSERAADTSDNDRRTRMEGAEINKSLLALKECIRALDQGQLHTPFRGSILTQVLKDGFVGNSRTVMIANIGPNSGSCEHTLNSLRYADRVKQLKKGAVAPLPAAQQPAEKSGSKSARGLGSGSGAAGTGAGAGSEAYMPHHVSAVRNTKLGRLGVDRSFSSLAAAAAEGHALSASPSRAPTSARSSTNNVLHSSVSVPQLHLHSSPARAAGGGPPRSVRSSMSAVAGESVSPPLAPIPSPARTTTCARASWSRRTPWSPDTALPSTSAWRA
jgi:hypothetical protein